MYIQIITGILGAGVFIYSSVISSSETDKLMAAIEGIKKEIGNVIKDATKEITNEIERSNLEQNFHNAFTLAFSAQKSVDDCVTWIREQRIQASDKYWEAENDSQRAVTHLMLSKDGKPLILVRSR